MLLIVGTVRLPPANLEKARPAMRAMVSASRAEDGCVEYAYAEDVLDRGLIHVKEIWRDQAALDRHFASDHIAVWRASWPALGIGDRDLHAYEVEKKPRAT
ncbi:putative quinol monooxygenase [Labrys monachus]|uniref:Quinol monooxygenase YgiN n=1 Tax=Labrys monachus TaxID=217067 RepID=A0ABU0FMT9_9HYPH|nr:putative quinol monooxygenase [Labrys monachus]MDQ0395370.1 quinol monooxygenase YgiN [Labrys monachus]